MFHFVFNVRLVPGKRMTGINHATKLAAHLKEQYNVDSKVLGNEVGAVYSIHFVMMVNSLAQLEEVNDQLLPGDFYQSWFAQSMQEGIYDWSSADTRLYRVHYP